MVTPDIAEDDEPGDDGPAPTSSTTPGLAETGEDAVDDVDEAEARQAAADEALEELRSAEPVLEEEMATPRFSSDAGSSTGGGSGMFDGTEDTSDFSDPSEFENADEDDSDRARPEFEESINRGFARLAVIGIEDEAQKESLNEEFRDVFAEFRLGHYGELCIQEYLLIDEEIDPVYGFTASLLVCFMMVLYLRPDGTEIAQKMTAPVKGTLGGRLAAAGDSE